MTFRFGEVAFTLVILVSLVGLSLELFSSNSAIVNLTPKNFDSLVKNSNDPWVVEFYSPVCGYCKQFAPEYEHAAKRMKNSGVRFGVVDAVEYDELGDRFKVRGYPTVKLFGTDKNKPEDYTGRRTAQSLIETAKQLAEPKSARRSRGRRYSMKKDAPSMRRRDAAAGDDAVNERESDAGFDDEQSLDGARIQNSEALRLEKNQR